MKVIYLDELNCINLQPSCVAFGFFDGIHLGHQQLINKVINICNETGLKKGLMTFDNQPKAFLLNQPFKYLMSLDDKINYLKELGFDYLFVIRFNHDFAAIEPQKFIDDYIKLPQIKHVVCGYDFHFGKNGKGDGNYLIEHSNNFEVSIIEKLEYLHHKISSTYLRKLLKDGQVELVNELLKRNYSVQGEIIHGRQNGRKIGFPTINVDALDYVLPKNGVYGVYVYLDEKQYLAMANIGFNPTFSALDKVSLEVNIFDFDEDVYGKIARVEFINYVRPEQKFKGIDLLVEQLNKDRLKIKKIFRKE